MKKRISALFRILFMGNKVYQVTYIGNKPEYVKVYYTYGWTSRDALADAIVHENNLNTQYPLREYNIRDLHRIGGR
ncbi:MAG: hypothetical protein PHX21_13560 [bacterium]|nr:hypothetical protein [bacterium]